MKYTTISKYTKEELDNLCTPPIKGVVRLSKVKQDPSYFMYHQLGLRPYTYQHMIFRELKHKSKRIAVCSSRQIGKSVTVAVLSLWAARYNVYPSGISKNTKVCVVSSSYDQAKKLMSEIKKLILIGDSWLKKAWNVDKFFSSHIDSNATNTVTQITFQDGCTIKCFPPTEAIRGETGDLLIVDEAAFVDTDTFRESMEPTISATNGRIILTSTPKGQSGFFFNVFDPFDSLEEHDYKRFWFPYTVCENKEQLKNIKKKHKIAKLNGDLKSFKQEYEALFTIDADSFLNSDKIDASIEDNYTQEYEYHDNPCVLGIDYGITKCHSVLTISTMEDGVIRLLFQYSYPLNSDDNLIIPDIEDLSKRFNIETIVVDDCPQGHTINQRLINMGYNVNLFNFRSDQSRGERNRGYFKFRSALNSGRIKIPRINELIIELKQLQEIKLAINVKITKPKGGSDDRADSFMMSTIPFLNVDNDSFESVIISNNPSDEINISPETIREDMLWKGYLKINKHLGGV